MKLSNYIRIVLVEPSHPGNVGSIARSMANMGIGNLALVAPRDFPSPVASSRACGADWILDGASVYRSLDEAVEDCALVFGTTARRRSISWPTVSPEEAMNMAVEAGSRFAVVFGRERNGLENRELDCCNYMIRIDVDEGFPSMNLASAATILSYEFRKAAQGRRESELPEVDYATSEQLGGLIEHLEETLLLTEFLDGRSSLLIRKLRRLFNRSRLSREEVNILRGILTSMERKAGRKRPVRQSPDSGR